MVIKVSWTRDSTELVLKALNEMDNIPFSRSEAKKMYLSIRDELEPRINANKRKDLYKTRLKIHQAQVVVFALRHCNLDYAPNPLLPSLSRLIIKDIQPQL